MFCLVLALWHLSFISYEFVRINEFRIAYTGLNLFIIGGVILNKQKRILIAEIIGVFFVFGLAFVFHFMYGWSGYNSFVGIFAAHNESVFEHTKILFYPFIIYSIIEYFFLHISLKRFFISKAIPAISLIFMVIIFHYTYTGIIGYHIGWVDILLTFIYTVLASFISYRLLNSKSPLTKAFVPILIAFIVTMIGMLIFTLFPPKISLFYDSMHDTFGTVQTKE